MSAIKRVSDPLKGSYDVLVAGNTNTLGTVVSGSSLVVSNVVSASEGGILFPLSSSATTVKFPNIVAAKVGVPVRVLADSTALTLSGTQGFSSPSSAWTVTLPAYSSSFYVAASGALGFYWHVV